MSENGESKKSLPGDVISLLEDQMELASLEWKYEKSQGVRRMAALVAAAVLACTAFGLLQVAIVQGLQAAGLSIVKACLIMTGVYGVLAGGLVWFFNRRDPRVGEPFLGTRREIRKNIQWIRQLFS